MVSNRVLSSAQHGVVSGLGSALRQALRGQDALWCGWDGLVSNEAAAHARLYQDDAIQYASFSLLPDEYRHYYVGFCNSTLWP